MKGMTRGAALLGVWLLALALLYLVVAHTLRLSSDLRLFLPEAATREQRLVLEGIGEGPASRMLLIALGGADTGTLARVSRQLVDALRASPAFLRIDNGSAQAIPDFVTRYRYLLSPAMDQRRLDAAALREALVARLQDLASPAAPLIEPFVPSDPTLEVLSIAESWEPPQAPRMIEGAWFDTAGTRALLVAETRAAGFDPDGQQRALSLLETAFEAARGDSGVRITVSGPGRFSALMKERTQREASWLGTAAAIALLLLMFIAYRRPRVLLLAALPLASAALAGLACVSVIYGSVHGITLAFGFTLIGIAQDYPVHLFSHQYRGLDPAANARALWPTLATGVASTCIGYLAFVGAGVTGLTQLAWFTIAGLVVAGLSTRYLLPFIAGEDFRDAAEYRHLGRIEAGLRLPVLTPLRYASVASACLAIAFLAPGRFWENDLGALTPVPAELLRHDAALRRELGAPDVRYLAAITAATVQQGLERLEDVTPSLNALVADGAISGFDDAARYLPSARRQRERQQSLPAPAELADALSAARQGLPFRAGVFAPFLRDVAHSRELPPLEPAALGSSPEAPLLEGMLRQTGGQQTALVVFSGVSMPQRLVNWAAAAGPGVVLIDLKRESEALVIRQRERMLWCLAAAGLLLVAMVRASLGNWQRAIRVLAPMVLATLATLAALRMAGLALNLFHLISLVLAAGLGLDYALFFERAGPDRKERLRTLHAILVCAASTLLVFALLSASSLPVLRSIGMTVALGVLFNFLFSHSMSQNAKGQ
jgi:predicted exporter